MPSSSWYCGERAADGHLERRLVVAAVLPVRGHVAVREAVLGALLADRERHLLEHQQRGDDLRDAGDRQRSAAEASGAPMPATLIAALPSAGHGGAAAGAAAACTVIGLDDGRDRVQGPEQRRGGVGARDEADQRGRHDHARVARASAAGASVEQVGLGRRA